MPPTSVAAVTLALLLATFATTGAAFADDSELRIARPAAQAEVLSSSFVQSAPGQIFQKPVIEAPSRWIAAPVFCTVLMCHGSCQHREGPCTLRTFKGMLGIGESAGCCAAEHAAGSPKSADKSPGCHEGGEDQCCSHEQ